MNNNFPDLSPDYDAKPRDYYELSREELLPLFPADIEMVLDVGCANGLFGKLLKKERNCTVWGVEPQKQAFEEASKNLDRVINRTFSEDIPELKEIVFDVVCFNDVLEHTVSPEILLQTAKQYLQPNGVVCASIPNILYYPIIYQILKEQDWRYTDSGVLDKTHLRFFTKASIIRMFQSCGFEVVKLIGMNDYTDWRYRTLNTIFLNHLSDWKFMQFGIQAKLTA